MSSTSDEVKQWPPHKHAISVLEGNGTLAYGKFIPWTTIEQLFNCGDRDDWAFRSEYIKFSDKLKESGFLLTECGTNGEGIRILTREEMAAAVKSRELSKANDSLRNSRMLSNVPRDGLSEATIKALDHWETKTAVVGATSKVLLRRRHLPTPEMAIKSITTSAKG